MNEGHPIHTTYSSIENNEDKSLREFKTLKRKAFEVSTASFDLGKRLKEERKKSGLTQEQLAARIGTKKSYISRIERGHADVQLSTLFRIFAGLGRKVFLNVQ